MADKNRRTILTMLKDRDRNVNQILINLGIGQATLSSHLAVLRKAGLVFCRVNGKQRIYSLNKNAIGDLLRDIRMLIDDEIIVRRKMV